MYSRSIYKKVLNPIAYMPRNREDFPAPPATSNACIIMACVPMPGVLTDGLVI